MNDSPQQTYGQYKMRVTSRSNTGESYGITLPKPVADKFKEVKFQIFFTDTMIILKSGIDLVKFKEEVDKYGFTDII